LSGHSTNKLNPQSRKGLNRKPSNDQEIIHTVSLGLIHITDISFPWNRKGLWKPLKTMWKS